MSDNQERKGDVARPSVLTTVGHFSFKIVKIVFAVITGVSAVFGRYSFFSSRDVVPEVQFEIVDCRRLTKISGAPGLTSEFFFKGRRVNELWLAQAKIVNDCRRNIIGSHGNDLMTSNICFHVSEGYNIILAELASYDFPVSVSHDTNSFSISFGKWKPQQSCVVNVYCECDNVVNDCDVPRFISEDEPFQQGELTILDYREARQTKSLLNRLPYWISRSLDCVGIVLFALLAFLGLWLLFPEIGWYKTFKWLRWNRRYLSRVKAILASQETSEANTSIDINNLPLEFWISNRIPIPPPESKYVKDKKLDWESLSVPLILGSIMFVSSALALLALISV